MFSSAASLPGGMVVASSDGRRSRRIETWGPSLVIAASTVAAFVVGRLLAVAAARWPRAARILRIVVLTLAVLTAAWVLITPSSRYALLLPAAFAAAFFSYGHARIAPGVFRG